MIISIINSSIWYELKVYKYTIPTYLVQWFFFILISFKSHCTHPSDKGASKGPLWNAREQL